MKGNLLLFATSIVKLIAVAVAVAVAVVDFAKMCKMV